MVYVQIFWGFNRFFEKRLFITSCLKYLFTLFLYLASSRVTSQTVSKIELNYSKSDVRVPRVIAKTPVALAAYLTKDKTTEKEKFDAIFAWVASNIHYDWYAYFSSSGYGKSDITNILKHKYAICLGYSNLMDTLCKLSAIENVTVYGYAKDELFDVNDSLYIDNHAWNAVKLDNKWFVYDVTWASGRPTISMTKWSKFKYDLYVRAFKKRTLQKQICEKIIKTECDTVAKIKRDTILVEKRTFWNKVILKMLSKTKYKFKRSIIHKINSDYYLCDPDTFAITHFPNDPAWALTNKHHIREFECDSAFYHMNDSTYKHQVRYGRYCGDCDSYLSYNDLNKYIRLRDASALNNKRNLFIKVLCNYNICSLKFNESKNHEDSLTKVALLDTAIFYNDVVKGNLRKSFSNIEIDCELQRNKNRNKEKALLDENTIYRDFINKHKHLIRTQHYSVKNIERLFRNCSAQLKRQKNRIYNLEHKEAIKNVKNTEEKIRELTTKTLAADSTIVAFDSLILDVRFQFNLMQMQVNKNIDYKILQNDSVFGPFLTSTYLRMFGLDNYKKPIVLVRKDINRNKWNYIKDLDEMIFNKVEQWEKLAINLFDLIQKRNKLAENNFKVKSELVRRGKLESSVLMQYKANMLAKNKEDMCWIKSAPNNLYLTFGRFMFFLRKQEEAYFCIERENRMEGWRYIFTEKEIQRRKRKYRNIVINNLRVATKQGHIVNKEKREFLKKLRKERREAAKKKQ